MEQGIFATESTYRLFFGNLRSETTEEALKAMVERFGKVRNVYLVKVMTTGQSRGFAFVEMTDEQEAARTISALNGTEVDGRCLKVRLGF